MAPTPFAILLAEDSEHDVFAIRRAWKKHQIANPLYIVTDGEACLDYLYQRRPYHTPEAAPRPGLLLLDLVLPRYDGLSILQHIRTDDTLQYLPVIMLTASLADQNRLRSYDFGASAYIKKPSGSHRYIEVIRTIVDFWQLVDLPEIYHGHGNGKPTLSLKHSAR